MIVLDASALLAFLFRETGHEQVLKHIADSCMSAVNLSEVIGRFVRDGHPHELVLSQIVATNIEIVPFTANHAAITASLLPQTKQFGLSITDRACLALALSRNIPALTADKIWLQANVGVEVITIR